MQEPQHLEAAATLLALSEREFAGGYELLAAEALWGAAAHAVIAHAQRRNWRTPRSHRAIKGLARDLANRLGDPSVLSGVEAAEKLHEHFYRGAFSAEVLRGYQTQAVALMEKLLSV